SFRGADPEGSGNRDGRGGNDYNGGRGGGNCGDWSGGCGFVGTSVFAGSALGDSGGGGVGRGAAASGAVCAGERLSVVVERCAGRRNPSVSVFSNRKPLPLCWIKSGRSRFAPERRFCGFTGGRTRSITKRTIRR